MKALRISISAANLEPLIKSNAWVWKYLINAFDNQNTSFFPQTEFSQFPLSYCATSSQQMACIPKTLGGYHSLFCLVSKKAFFGFRLYFWQILS